MKTIMAVVVCAAFAGTLVSAEALQIKSFADFKEGKKASPYVKNIENGVRINNNGKFIQLLSNKQIPIDLKKKYRISFEYRQTPGSKFAGRFFAAPVCFDKNGKEIFSRFQNCQAGTDTVLAAAAKKGDKIIKIKNGAKWVVKYGYVAFNTKANYADLPNCDLVPIASIKKNGAVWEIALKAPLAKAYPAGTAVREQRDAASYRYMIGNGLVKAQWQKFSRILTGVRRKGVAGYGFAWRPGTAKAGLIIFANSKVDMEIRNISIKEVK